MMTTWRGSVVTLHRDWCFLNTYQEWVVHNPLLQVLAPELHRHLDIGPCACAWDCSPMGAGYVRVEGEGAWKVGALVQVPDGFENFFLLGKGMDESSVRADALSCLLGDKFLDMSGDDLIRVFEFEVLAYRAGEV